MDRIKKLSPILDLAEKREDLAVQELGRSRQKLDAAQKNLNSLRAFRENYTAQFNRSGNQGLSVHRLNEFRTFLGKINLAIADQERLVQQAENELQAASRAWEDAHRHMLGMQKLVDKLATEQAQQEQKKEQGEIDDRVGRRGNRNKTLPL